MEKNYVVMSVYTDDSGWVDIFGPFTKKEAEEFRDKENEKQKQSLEKEMLRPEVAILSEDEKKEYSEEYDSYRYITWPMLTETTNFKARNTKLD